MCISSSGNLGVYEDVCSTSVVQLARLMTMHIPRVYVDLVSTLLQYTASNHRVAIVLSKNFMHVVCERVPTDKLINQTFLYGSIQSIRTHAVRWIVQRTVTMFLTKPPGKVSN